MGAKRLRRPVNVEAARNWRKRGKSYAFIGEKLGHSESAIWYALNRRKRSSLETPAGWPRTVHLGDEEWGLVGLWAKERGVSRSVILSELVAGEVHLRSQMAALEPEIPGV